MISSMAPIAGGLEPGRGGGGGRHPVPGSGGGGGGEVPEEPGNGGGGENDIPRPGRGGGGGGGGTVGEPGSGGAGGGGGAARCSRAAGCGAVTWLPLCMLTTGWEARAVAGCRPSTPAFGAPVFWGELPRLWPRSAWTLLWALFRELGRGCPLTDRSRSVTSSRVHSWAVEGTSRSRQRATGGRQGTAGKAQGRSGVKDGHPPPTV